MIPRNFFKKILKKTVTQDEESEYTGYHGTSITASDIILKSKKYICEENYRHWLGQGIYFFKDVQLSKWWAEKRFSNEKDILKSKIKASKDMILDLAEVEGYKKFQEFSDDVTKGFAFERDKDEKDEHFKMRIRCAVFDTYSKINNIALIIGYFGKPAPSYLDNKTLVELDMPFIEIQYCVLDNKYIFSTERVG